MNFWGMIEERYEDEIPQDVKMLCRGYAAGINKYLLDNPSKKKKKILKSGCRGYYRRLLPSHAFYVWFRWCSKKTFKRTFLK